MESQVEDDECDFDAGKRSAQALVTPKEVDWYPLSGIMQWFNESQGLPFLNYSADLNELFSFCSPLPTLQLAKQPAS